MGIRVDIGNRSLKVVEVESNWISTVALYSAYCT